jgi:hypothetical protein
MSNNVRAHDLDNVFKDSNKLMEWAEKKMTPSRLYLACKFLVVYFEEEKGMKLSKTDEEILHARGVL